MGPLVPELWSNTISHCIIKIRGKGVEFGLESEPGYGPEPRHHTIGLLPCECTGARERASVWLTAACLTRWTGVTTSYTKGWLTLSQQKPSMCYRAQGGVDLVITAKQRSERFKYSVPGPSPLAPNHRLYVHLCSSKALGLFLTFLLTDISPSL